MSSKMKYILRPMLFTIAWMGLETALILWSKLNEQPGQLLVLLIIMTLGMAMNIGSYAASNYRHIKESSTEWAWHLFWYKFITELHAKAEERGERIAPLPDDQHKCMSLDETHICVWPGCWEKVK